MTFEIAEYSVDLNRLVYVQLELGNQDFKELDNPALARGVSFKAFSVKQTDTETAVRESIDRGALGAFVGEMLKKTMELKREIADDDGDRPWLAVRAKQLEALTTVLTYGSLEAFEPEEFHRVDQSFSSSGPGAGIPLDLSEWGEEVRGTFPRIKLMTPLIVNRYERSASFNEVPLVQRTLIRDPREVAKDNDKSYGFKTAYLDLDSDDI